MMMKKILVVMLVASASYQSWGQKAAPAQTLRLATSTYEQGRLHELEGILGNIEGFSKEQKVAAYKLLTQAYIYLEEPKKADTTMLNLLATDNYFAINKEIDPVEFVALYNTFRTEPVYAIGLKLGGGLVQPTVVTDFYTSADAQGTGEYKPGIGFMGGFFFEKKLKGKFTFSPELLVASRSFTDLSKLFKDDISGEVGGEFKAKYSQALLEINAIVQYKLRESVINPYLGAGPGFSYVFSSKLTPTATGLSKTSVSGADVDIASSTKKMLYSFFLVGGFKYRIGGIFVIAEFRYQYGINKVINFDTRTNYENSLDYGNQLNDFRVSNASLTLGVSYPIFKPAKLKNK